jgi:hypothetical protein
MNLARLAFLAFVAGLGFLILFIADREREAGVERLSNYKMVPRSALEADPSVKPVSTPAPPARTAR